LRRNFHLRFARLRPRWPSPKPRARSLSPRLEVAPLGIHGFAQVIQRPRTKLKRPDRRTPAKRRRRTRQAGLRPSCETDRLSRVDLAPADATSICPRFVATVVAAAPSPNTTSMPRRGPSLEKALHRGCEGFLIQFSNDIGFIVHDDPLISRLDLGSK
jgi:hypothetical protein